MFTSILSVCPPSSVTSRLDRAASTSSISGSLEWSRGSLDMVSLQMWYWGKNESVYSLRRKPSTFIIAMIEYLVPTSHYEVLRHDLRGYARLAWVRRRLERSYVCQPLHQCVGECNTAVIHCPSSCKMPAEWIRELKFRMSQLSWKSLVSPLFPLLNLSSCTSLSRSVPFQWDFPHVLRCPWIALRHQTPSPGWRGDSQLQDTHKLYLRLI